MRTLSCLNCKNSFQTKRNDTKFCSTSCRYQHWAKKNTSYKKEYATLEDLKEGMQEHRQEFSKIVRHFDRAMEMYSDWEDRAVKLENRLTELEAEVQEVISEIKDDIEKVDIEISDGYDAFSDPELFGDLK